MSDRDTPTGPQEPVNGGTPTERNGANDGDTPAERTGANDGDTPTERFDPRAPDADGETPTERFDAADAGNDEATRRLPQQPDRAYPEPRFPEGYSPTTRLPNPGSDAPTERFGQAATPAWQPSPSSVPAYATTPTPQQRTGSPPPPKSKGPLIALIIIGTLLVVGIAVLLLVLATQGNTPAEPSASPTTSETPSATPSETPTPTPTPTPEPAAAAAFVSFSPENDTQISCPDEESTVPITFTWTSTDADRAWIAAGETDARANPDAEVDPSGTYRDLEFDCSRDSEIYTVSLENSEGELTSESVTLRRALD